MKKQCEVCGKMTEMLPWEETCYFCEKEQKLKRIQKEIAAGEEFVDTWSDDYVICPHCGTAMETDLSYDDFPEIYEEGEHTIECDVCGKMFVLETEASFSWQTRKGGEEA